MEADRLERVKEILGQALDLAPSARQGFLADACDGDGELRREVASLLEREADAPPWPEGPLLTVACAGEGEPVRLTPGERIGPYRVERRLGQGGMGTVALAVREDDFTKQVALKVVHARVAGPLLQRFHDERQILAQLEHPHIARILDGGTADDGRPYFAMELVEGEPVDLYCGRRGLGVRERLELVLSVCSALEVAHRSLIVHRDVKPANILVTPQGVPKLLDFGIAKRLDPGVAERTRHAERPMTLRYASPEQVEGGAITTATDVYGVGLLLYRLLAGRHPFIDDEGSDLRLAEAIRWRVPPRLSGAAEDPGRRRELAGDLDAIVARALRKEPDQRYGSMAELAEDLRRHLEGRPVLARQGTWVYLASRFVRRHRLPLAAAAMLLVSILAFGLAATVLWRRAEQARRSAEAAREQAVAVQAQKDRALEFFKEVLWGGGPNRARGQQDRTAFELLREAEEALLGEEATVEAELRATIGQVYTQWGLLDEAGRAWRRAEELLRRHYPSGHPDLAKAINNVASWHYRAGDHARAADLYREALEMKEGFPEAEGVDVAKAMSNLATALMELGETGEVEGLYRGALELRRRAPEPDLDDVGQSLRSLGVYYHEQGDLGQAEELTREAIETFRSAYGTDVHTRFATALNGLGRVLHDQGKPTEALPIYLRALEIRRELLGEDHLHVVSSRLDLARLYLETGQRRVGRTHLDRALAWLAGEPGDQHLPYRGRVESLLGAYLAAEGRFAEAEPHLVTGHRILVEGRRRPDQYGRRAARRLEELYAAWGRPPLPGPLERDGGSAQGTAAERPAAVLEAPPDPAGSGRGEAPDP